MDSARGGFRGLALGLILSLLSLTIWIPRPTDALVFPIVAETVPSGASDGFDHQFIADGITNVKQEGGTPGTATVTLWPNGDAASVGWDDPPCDVGPDRYIPLSDEDDATCRAAFLANPSSEDLPTDLQDIIPPGIVSDYDVTATGRVGYFGDEAGVEVALDSPSGCGGDLGASTKTAYTNVDGFFERCSGPSEWTKPLIDRLRIRSRCSQSSGIEEFCRVTQHKLVVDITYVGDFSLDFTSRFADVFGVGLSVRWNCTTADEDGLDLYIDGSLAATEVCSKATTGTANMPDIAVPRAVDVRLVSRNVTGDPTPSMFAFDLLRVEGSLNRNPRADAGPDQSVLRGTSVRLNGSGSSDPDGHVLAFEWSQVAGPAVSLSGSTGPNRSFTASLPGVYAFELVVSDGFGGVDGDVAVITALNRAPMAEAGPNRAWPKLALVSLNGIASSDPDGDNLAFSWRQLGGPTVTLSNATSPTPSFLPTEAATFSFLLTVEDGYGGIATDAVVADVWSRAPTARITASVGTARVGSPVTFDGSGSSDADGTLAEYRFDFDDDTVVRGSDTSVSHAFAASGTYTVLLTVTDDEGNASTDEVTVLVTDNVAPDATASVWPATIGFVGTPLWFAGGNSTDDVGIARHAWHFGDGTTGEGATVAHAYTAKGTFTVRLIVTDSDGATDESLVVVTVANRPPVLRARSPDPQFLTRHGKSAVTFAVYATDPDGDVLTYAWTVDNRPAGWDSPFFELPSAGTSSFVVNVNVSDGTSHVLQAWTIMFEPPPLTVGSLLPELLLAAIAFVLVFVLLRQRRARRLPSPPSAKAWAAREIATLGRQPAGEGGHKDGNDLGLGLLDEVIADQGASEEETKGNP